MGISVIIPYHCFETTWNLEYSLRALSRQVLKPDQVIVVDDSAPADKPAVRRICSRYGVTLRDMEYREMRQHSRKFNIGFGLTTEDIIFLHCANTLLSRTALTAYRDAIMSFGPGNILVSDSQRQQMDGPNGEPLDWFYYKSRDYAKEVAAQFGIEKLLDLWPSSLVGFMAFPIKDFSLIDCGFTQMLHREDWLPWDEDFDECGSWHALTEWGYRLIEVEGKQLWVLRGMTAWHLPRADEHIQPINLEQTMASQRILEAKIPSMPSEYMVEDCPS